MELARLRRRIGWVFQGLSLLSRLAVWENVTYALIPRGVGRSTRRAIAKELLHRVGLGHRIAAAPETLSGGERQRVAVARALAGQPEAVLADEPTSSLDPAARQSIAALFADVWQAGTTLIVASHDAELLKLATLRFELDNGTLRDTLTPACGQASQRE
jgi:ABC-type ATPase involved in cell division